MTVDDEWKEFFINLVDKCVDLISSVKTSCNPLEQLDETVYFIYETLIYVFEKLEELL